MPLREVVPYMSLDLSRFHGRQHFPKGKHGRDDQIGLVYKCFDYDALAGRDIHEDVPKAKAITRAG